MKGQVIYRVLTVIGLIGVLGALVSFAGEKPAPVTVDEWVPYTSPGGGFTISFPSGWAISESNLHETELQITSKGPHGVRLKVNQSLTNGLMTDIAKASAGGFGQAPTKSAVKESHELETSVLERLLPDYVEINSGEDYINDQEVQYTEYTYTLKNGLAGRSMCGMVATTMNLLQPVQFKLECPQEQYESVKENGILLNMVTSFVPGNK